MHVVPRREPANQHGPAQKLEEEPAPEKPPPPPEKPPPPEEPPPGVKVDAEL